MLSHERVPGNARQLFTLRWRRRRRCTCGDHRLSREKSLASRRKWAASSFEIAKKGGPPLRESLVTPTKANNAAAREDERLEAKGRTSTAWFGVRRHWTSSFPQLKVCFFVGHGKSSCPFKGISILLESFRYVCLSELLSPTSSFLPSLCSFGELWNLRGQVPKLVLDCRRALVRSLGLSPFCLLTHSSAIYHLVNSFRNSRMEESSRRDVKSQRTKPVGNLSKYNTNYS